jgi:hypothetical protein
LKRVLLILACVAGATCPRDVAADEAVQVPAPPAEERSLVTSQAGINTSNSSPTAKHVADQTPAGIRKHVDQVFDRNKGAIYALYGRALHDEPGIQGKVLFELQIATDGSVTRCSIVSSELRAPALEQKLCSRIGLLRFGAFDEAQSITKVIEFLPAT